MKRCVDDEIMGKEDGLQEEKDTIHRQMSEGKNKTTSFLQIPNSSTLDSDSLISTLTPGLSVSSPNMDFLGDESVEEAVVRGEAQAKNEELSMRERDTEKTKFDFSEGLRHPSNIASSSKNSSHFEGSGKASFYAFQQTDLRKESCSPASKIHEKCGDSSQSSVSGHKRQIDKGLEKLEFPGDEDVAYSEKQQAYSSPRSPEHESKKRSFTKYPLDIQKSHSNDDDDLIASDDETLISEKVQKMRNDDEDFIEEKMKELSRLKNDSASFLSNEIPSAKARLTHVVSSRSRDLDDAFIEYQLKQIRAGSTECEQSFERNRILKRDDSSDNDQSHFSVSKKDTEINFQRGHRILEARKREYSANETNFASNLSVSSKSNDIQKVLKPRLKDSYHPFEYEESTKSVTKSKESSSSLTELYDLKCPHSFDDVTRSRQNQDFENFIAENSPYGYGHAHGNLIMDTRNIVKCVQRILYEDLASNPESLHMLSSCMMTEEGKQSLIQANGPKAIITSIWKYLETPHILIPLISALCTLYSSSSTEQKDVIFQSGCAEAILCAMQSNFFETHVQVYSCRLLESLSENKNNQITLMKMGVITSISTLMRKHEKNVLLQIWGLRVISAMCKNDLSGERIIEVEKQGYLYMISEVLDFRSEEILQWVCRLLWFMSNNQSVGEKILSRELRLMTKIMSGITNTHDHGMSSFCGLLENLTGVSRSGSRDIGGVGIDIIVETIVSFMNKNKKHAQVQFHCCRALSNIAALSESNRCIIAEYGGVNSIFGVAESFSRDEFWEELVTYSILCCIVSVPDGQLSIAGNVMKYVFEVMGKYCYSDKLGILEYTCGIVANIPIHSINFVGQVYSDQNIKIVIDVVNAHPMNISIQSMACQALERLSIISDVRDVLCSMDGIRTIIRAMKVHPSEYHIQLSCCICLWNISTDSLQHASEIVHQDGVGVIVSAMQSHFQSDKIQKTACGALWTIFANNNQSEKQNFEEKFTPIDDKSVIDAVICAIFTYSESTSVVENVCGVLSVLSMQASNAATLTTNGGIDALIETMRAHIHNSTIVEYICAIIRNIVVVHSFDDTQIKIQMIHSILRGMREHSENRLVQHEACDALWGLCTAQDHVQVKNEIIANKGMDLIMKVLKHENEDTHIIVRKTLESLIT